MLKSILIAGIGGFIGTVFRFLVSRYIQVTYLSVFPWGTFLVNILGSLLIGIFYGISEKGNFMSPEWRIFLTVGICGGFTTFSTFYYPLLWSALIPVSYIAYNIEPYQENLVLVSVEYLLVYGLLALEILKSGLTAINRRI
jgi:protein CrcB